MPDIFDQYAHARPEANPVIYAYELEGVASHEGYLKVGYTTRKAEVRVAETMHTSAVPYRIVLVEPAVRPDGTCFTDREVHAILRRRRFPQLNAGEDRNEWYRCTAGDVKAAIAELQTGIRLEGQRTKTFRMRPEQEEAVAVTRAYFRREERDAPHRRPKFLWNAKMRFGKTFAAYQLAKSMGLTKILVLTFKPVVEDAWEEDLATHVDFKGWQFYSRKTELDGTLRQGDIDMDRPVVCFGSFQDFLGTNAGGGIKVKNEWVHATDWDLVIFDEYHFGAWRENAKKLFEKQDEDLYDTLDIEKYKSDEADNAVNESFLEITTRYYLYLSGTPFRALNSGEFIEEQIFNWTYSSEQNAKENWKGPGPNPYAALPKMILMTYRIPDSIRQIAYNEQYNEFDLNEFFAAEVKPGQPVKTAQFKHKDYVQKWLDLIRGSYMPTTVDNLKLGQGQRPVMPYSDSRLLSVLGHTFWFLPNVASCHAMANLLGEAQNTFFAGYTVNVCAGASAGVGLDALAPVKNSMKDPLHSKTITLSCGKLTTGVTIKPWTGILMLRNLSSPETYFQAAFRVQSPWEVTGETGRTEIIKEECYIFDFALDRALRQIADYSCRLSIHEGNQEKKVGEFINFLPVLAYDGAIMKPVSATEILDIAYAGTSATLLARRWESALLVNVDNGTLQRLVENPGALDAIMKIEGFRNLNRDIQMIINRSEAVQKAKKEGTDGLTKEEKKELSDAEKEYKSRRKAIQEKLKKFAARIPVFMYLTDYREQSLKDVITQFEPGLFQKVTGLTVQDFELLVSVGVFNDSLMNEAIYKFKRYEDASLEYAGIRLHRETEDVGLFSTVISREDYENMEKQQTNSTVAPASTVAVSTRPAPKRSGPGKARPAPERLEEAPAGEEDFPREEQTIIQVHDGLMVEHQKFGVGFVVGEPSSTVTVRFQDGGEKRFVFPEVFSKGIIWKK